MSPTEFHEACHDACLECPQFRGYDDDTIFHGFGEFGNIPKKGMMKVIKFWRDDRLLWEMGYSECLPTEVLEIFDRIDELLNEAIKQVMEELN